MRRNAGTDFLTGNLFTDGDPNTSVPASVVGSDWLNIQQEEIANAITAAGLTIDQSNPYATNDKTQLTQAIRLLGGAGGGGGFKWTPVEGISPNEEFEYDDLVYTFDAGLGIGDQKLQAYLKVPEGYTAGKQIKLYLAMYSENAAGTILLQTRATLIRKNTDALTTVTNQRTSTNTQLTNALANQLRTTFCDLTSSTGQINSVAVAAGDIIKVELYRGSDTDTGRIRLMPAATEPKFQ